MSEPCLTGGCACGAVRFRLGTPATGASICHCTRCQRRTGTGSSVNAHVAGEDFRIARGAELLVAWRHPDGGYEKLFCGACGGHLYSRNPDDYSRIGVRMGAFDGDPGVRPSYRQFVAYAAAWDVIPEDGLRRYDESGRLEVQARDAGVR